MAPRAQRTRAWWEPPSSHLDTNRGPLCSNDPCGWRCGTCSDTSTHFVTCMANQAARVLRKDLSALLAGLEFGRTAAVALGHYPSTISHVARGTIPTASPRSDNTPRVHVRIQDAWANVNDAGHSNSAHTHGSSHVSGLCTSAVLPRVRCVARQLTVIRRPVSPSRAHRHLGVDHRPSMPQRCCVLIRFHG